MGAWALTTFSFRAFSRRFYLKRLTISTFVRRWRNNNISLDRYSKDVHITKFQALTIARLTHSLCTTTTTIDWLTVLLHQHLLLTHVLHVDRAVDHKLWRGALIAGHLLALVALDLQSKPWTETNQAMGQSISGLNPSLPLPPSINPGASPEGGLLAAALVIYSTSSIWLLHLIWYF